MVRAFVTATVAAFALTAQAALADEQVAGSGQVSATFSFDRRGEYKFTDLWLRIDRAGTTVFDEAVDIPTCQEPYCVPAGALEDSDTVRLRDLDADGEPEVLVDVFTGGAHCCFATEILRFDGSSYRARSRNWADSGYRLADLDHDGRPESRPPTPGSRTRSRRSPTPHSRSGCWPGARDASRTSPVSTRR
jgi:hypothetical protein